MEVMGLCPFHHRQGDPCIHFSKRALLDAMGFSSEQEILDEIDRLLGYH
jgi:hypothetical protein